MISTVTPGRTTSSSLAPGPADSFDLNMTAESFGKIAELVGQYKDICRITSITRQNDSYLVNHPDYIKHILLLNHGNYTKGVGFDRVKMLLGNGIIVSDGPFWRRQRRMMQPAFNRKVIAQLSKQIQQCNLELFEKWQKLADQQVVFDLQKVSSELALQIVLRALFGNDLDEIIAEHGENPFSILTEDMSRDIKLVLKFRDLNNVLLKVINKRRAMREDDLPFDFLSMFMSARDKATGVQMTDRELMDELMTMIIAGHETSAITLTWVWYFMSQHADVETKVQQEVDAGTYENIPEFEDLDQLKYVKQVVDESLRYYPPVWLFTRKAINDDQLGDYKIPAGSDIFITPYFLHRHADYWTDAEKFNPDRFEEEKFKQQHKQAYIPFSVGPRRCVGDFFAQVEMQMHVGLMARHFRLKMIDETPIELMPEINLRAKNPLKMKVIRR